MNIGDRNKKITIQAPFYASDGMSAAVKTGTYFDVATVWGAIWPISSDERTAALSRRVDITHRVNIQYRAKFSTAWRLKYDGRYFSIVGKIDPKEAHKELQFTCKEAA